MRFIISFILTAVLSFVVSLYLPWWTIAITAFIIGILVPQKPILAFFAGFLALFLLWSFLSWWLSSSNGHILSHKLSLMILKNDNPALLIIATGLIGALVAGFAAVSGSYLRPKN